ncbi:MAG: replication-relaxation family protein [Candidatus Nanopelagicales bacterium]
MSGVPRIALTNRLSDRDWQILTTVRAFKYLTTRQLARQHFELNEPAGVIPRNANHALARLRELGLLVNLERRIGGVRAGSGGYVWQITDQANRLLANHLQESRSSRVRTFEPGTTFLDHTLAIAEVVITLQEATRAGEVEIRHIELEPTCWRSYLGSAGERKLLKPDLSAVTVAGGFEDLWFWEVDRATEAPNRVVKKCLQYQEYKRTDREQRAYGLFPAVVWVVPHQRRREQLRTRLIAEPAIEHRLFTVITLDQLSELTCLGADAFTKQLDGQGGQIPHE